MFILWLFHFAFDKVLLKNFTTTTTTKDTSRLRQLWTSGQSNLTRGRIAPRTNPSIVCTLKTFQWAAAPGFLCLHYFHTPLLMPRDINHVWVSAGFFMHNSSQEAMPHVQFLACYSSHAAVFYLFSKNRFWSLISRKCKHRSSKEQHMYTAVHYVGVNRKRKRSAFVAQLILQWFLLGWTTPKISPFPLGICRPSNTWFLGTTKVTTPNSISISSAIFQGLMNVTTDRHTNRMTMLLREMQ